MTTDLIIDQGTAELPLYGALPDLTGEGYQAWSTPVYTSGENDVTTGQQLASLPENAVLTATYEAQVDNNHAGPDAMHIVNYTVKAPQAAPGMDSEYADTVSVTYGDTALPLPQAGSRTLPDPGAGWRWGEPAFSITAEELSNLGAWATFTAVYQTELLPYYKGTSFTRTVTYTVMPRHVEGGVFVDKKGGRLFAIVQPQNEELPQLPVGYSAWQFTGWTTEIGEALDSTQNPPYGTRIYANWSAYVVKNYEGLDVKYRVYYDFRP